MFTDRFCQRNPVNELLFRFLELAEKKKALTFVEMHPGPSFARVQFLNNFTFALGVFKSCFEVSGVNCIFTQKFVADCLRKWNLVLRAKLNRAAGPTIGLGIQPIMLMSPGGKGVHLR